MTHIFEIIRINQNKLNGINFVIKIDRIYIIDLRKFIQMGCCMDVPVQNKNHF